MELEKIEQNPGAVHKYLEINSDIILNSIADGVVVLGLDHKILFINRAARELLGRPEAEDLLKTGKCSDVLGSLGLLF